MTTIALALEDKQTLIKLEKYVIAFFSSFIYINVYCQKVHTSFLASHLWQVYIFRNITIKANHLTSGEGEGGGHWVH